MSLTHTPGPWAIEPVRNGRGEVLEYRIGHLALIASVPKLGGKAEADAVLIHAAPLLLEALEYAMEAIDYYHEREGADSMREEAREAIAKARGKTI